MDGKILAARNWRSKACDDAVGPEYAQLPLADGQLQLTADDMLSDREGRREEEEEGPPRTIRR